MLTHPIRRCAALTVALLALWSGARGEPAVRTAPQTEQRSQGDDEWVRLVEPDQGDPTALQTAIGSYTGRPAGARREVTVDLIGAIHVGDTAYYAELNRRFPQYDALLYELVAPQGTVVPRGNRARSDNPLGAMQNGMKGMLDLAHQLEQIDYTPRNFVHADMSLDELFASMRQRDEGFLSMYFRMMGQAIGEQTRASVAGESAEIDLVKALFAEDRPRRMKIAMASQMTQLEGLLTSFGGEKGTALIHERNRVALEEMERQIDKGRRRIGIFYGAGHLTDMDRRLREEFGMRQVGKEWLTAWDLSPQD